MDEGEAEVVGGIVSRRECVCATVRFAAQPKWGSVATLKMAAMSDNVHLLDKTFSNNGQLENVAVVERC